VASVTGRAGGIGRARAKRRGRNRARSAAAALNPGVAALVVRAMRGATAGGGACDPSAA
jgi:hypothetical protein